MTAGRHRRRMVRRIFGDEIERHLWPLLASIGLASACAFALFALAALYALADIGARATHVGFAFGASACAAIVGGIAGGRISARVGRRPVVTAAAVGQALLPALLLLPLGSLGAF